MASYETRKMQNVSDGSETDHVIPPAKRLKKEEKSAPTLASSMLALEENLALCLLEYLDKSKLSSSLYIYNPLQYAGWLHKAFLEMSLNKLKECQVLFLGLNPGPFGMMQNGVPFGNCHFVKNILELTQDVTEPLRKVHPRRPISGLSNVRSEISGKRFWDLVLTMFGTVDNFFQIGHVYNLCPLAFLDLNARNVTPVELEKEAREQILGVCRETLSKVLELLKPECVVGVGRVAEHQMKLIQKDRFEDIKLYYLPHPSPLCRGKGDWLQRALSILTNCSEVQNAVANQTRLL